MPGEIDSEGSNRGRIARLLLIVALLLVATSGSVGSAAAQRGATADAEPTAPPVRRTTAAAPTPVPERPAAAPIVATAVPSVDGAIDTGPSAADVRTEAEAAAAAVAAIEHDRSAGWQQRMGDAALRRLDYSGESLGFTVRFLPGRVGYLGMTFPERRTIEMYVREGLTVEDLARNLGHELGHAFDWVRNSAESRALYMQIRGIEPTRGWFACRGCTDLSTPAGDFAETFSFWLMGGTFPSRSHLGGGSPAPETLPQLETIFSPA
jgi:hypothetical protein